MLNIDTRLLDQIKTGQITSDEFVILLLIAKRINKKNEAFPSLSLLQEESKFGRDKLSNTLAGLEQKRFITKQQRHINGRLTSNLYKIHTKFISVFVTVDGEELTDDAIQVPENQYTEIQEPENQTVSINQSSLSINQSLEASLSNTPAQKIENEDWKSEIINHPMFEISKDRTFSNLDQSDIDYTLELYKTTLRGNQAHFTQAMSWLKNASLDKTKAEKVKAITTLKPYQSNYNKQPSSSSYEIRHPEGTYDIIPMRV